MVLVEPSPQAKIDIYEMFGERVVAITGDDGSSGTITPGDCEKTGIWGRPRLLFCELFGLSFCKQILANGFLAKLSLIIEHHNILGNLYLGKTIFWQHDILAK